MPATKERVYKLTLYARRNTNLTEEQFHEHWSKHHGYLASELLVKHGMLGYVQYHTASYLPGLSAVSDLAKMGIPKVEYDGIAVFHCRDDIISTLQAIYSDPDFGKIKEDEDYIFDRSPGGLTFSYGYEEVYIEDGKIIIPPNSS